MIQFRDVDKQKIFFQKYDLGPNIPPTIVKLNSNTCYSIDTPLHYNQIINENMHNTLYNYYLMPPQIVFYKCTNIFLSNFCNIPVQAIIIIY